MTYPDHSGSLVSTVWLSPFIHSCAGMVDAQRAALKAHCADTRVGAILVEGSPTAFSAGGFIIFPHPASTE